MELPLYVRGIIALLRKRDKLILLKMFDFLMLGRCGRFLVEAVVFMGICGGERG